MKNKTTSKNATPKSPLVVEKPGTPTRKKTKTGPEEFEEDLDMNIRMKPQPLKPQEKTSKKK